MPLITGSSNINAAGYDPAKGVLSIEFSSGDVFHYQNVTAKQHADLMASRSKGSWVAQNLVRRPNTHPATKAKK